MKKLLAALTLTLVCTLVLTVSAANATHSDGQGPKHDFAVGTGERPDVVDPTLDVRVHFNAKSGPSGEDPQGHFFETSTLSNLGPIDFRARVTCLNVRGTRATIGGVVERSREGFPPEGSGILTFVKDNGEPGDVDRNVVFFLTTPPDSCPLQAPASTIFAQGNTIVHDATP
jgi:hypothetical protein